MGLENDEKQDIEPELNANLEKMKNWLIQRRLTKGQLIQMCAALIVSGNEREASREELVEMIDIYETQINFSLAALKHGNLEAKMLTDYFRDWPTKQSELIERVSVIAKRNQHISAAKHAANSRHSKPGGSRDKQEKIRTIWASGKYSSRDICAEQECAALDMSFSVARKALRNTPDPT